MNVRGEESEQSHALDDKIEMSVLRGSKTAFFSLRLRRDLESNSDAGMMRL